MAFSEAMNPVGWLSTAVGKSLRLPNGMLVTERFRAGQITNVAQNLFRNFGLTRTNP